MSTSPDIHAVLAAALTACAAECEQHSDNKANELMWREFYRGAQCAYLDSAKRVKAASTVTINGDAPITTPAESEERCPVRTITNELTTALRRGTGRPRRQTSTCKPIHNSGASQQMPKRTVMDVIDILGVRATDIITGAQGVVVSVSFDVFGSILALVVAQGSRDSEATWYDVRRLVLPEHKDPVITPVEYDLGIEIED